MSRRQTYQGQTYVISRHPTTGRYYAVVTITTGSETGGSTLGYGWGWPTKDDAIGAAKNYIDDTTKEDDRV